MSGHEGLDTLILLGLLLANPLLHLTAPFFWIWVAVVLRATQLAIGYQRSQSSG